MTTSLNAGVDLRDVQIAARHADPRTTMRYDRARTNLDRLGPRSIRRATRAHHLGTDPAGRALIVAEYHHNGHTWKIIGTREMRADELAEFAKGGGTR